MSDDKMSDDKDKATPAAATGATPSPETGTEIKSDKIEMVESPPLAPEIAPVIAPVNAPAIEPFTAPAASGLKLEPEMAGPAKADTVVATGKLADFASMFTLPKVALPPLRMPKLTRRTRWRGLIAASMAFAAGVGASIGAIAVAPKNPPSAAVTRDASAAERDEMQKTIAKLNKEVSALKTNIESSAKATSAQLGKLNDKLKDSEKASESARRASVAPDTTGSIAPAVPVPAPRPVVAEAKPVIVDGWNIRSARDGLVLVEGRGEVFEVVVGAPLPGLGRVEEIKRQNGQWVVVTPKGIIVAAARPRGYFERPYDRY